MSKQEYRPFVTDVETTVKGPKRHVSVGQRTVVVGLPASGKSAIGQSLQLVYSASADGVDGRDDVKGSRLSRLAGAGLPLTVEALYSDKEVAQYHMAADGGRGALEPQHKDLDPDYAMPVRMVRNALSASDKAAREHFLRWITTDVKEDTLIQLVAPDLRDTFRRALRANKKDNIVDSLLAVVKWAGKQKRDAAKQAKGARTLLEEIEAPAIPVTDEQLENLREDVSRMRTQIDQQEATNEAIKLYDQLDRALVRLGELRDNLNYRKLNKEGIEESIKDSQRKFAEQHRPETCDACGQTVNDTTYDWKEDCPDAAGLMTDWRDADDRVKKLLKDISDEEKKESYASRRLGELGYDPLDEPPIAAAAVDLSQDLTRAEERLEKAVEAKATWRQLEQARSRARSMDKEAERYKDIESECHNIIATLLLRNVREFARRVSDNLPEDWSFSLTLVDEKGKDTFSWEIDKGDDREHRVLSGSEFESVLLALAETVMEVNSYEGPALCMPSDRGWSGPALTKITRALRDSTCQIVIESTVAPSEEVEGWTYIYLDSAQVTTQNTAEVASTPAVEVIGLDTQEPTVQKSPPREPLPARWVAYLKSLGYADDQIAGFSQGQARQIIRDGVVA